VFELPSQIYPANGAGMPEFCLNTIRGRELTTNSYLLDWWARLIVGLKYTCLHLPLRGPPSVIWDYSEEISSLLCRIAPLTLEGSYIC